MMDAMEVPQEMHPVTQIVLNPSEQISHHDRRHHEDPRGKAGRDSRIDSQKRCVIVQNPVQQPQAAGIKKGLERSVAEKPSESIVDHAATERRLLPVGGHQPLRQQHRRQTQVQQR